MFLALENAYSDITQRRVTAEEFIQNARPDTFFVSLGLEQQRTLKNKLEKARRSCVEQLVRFYSRNVRKEAVDSLLTLFFLLQQQREEIPNVFELWSVCLNQVCVCVWREGEERNGGRMWIEVGNIAKRNENGLFVFRHVLDCVCICYENKQVLLLLLL